MNIPIKFDPNDRIGSDNTSEKSKKASGVPGKFKEIIDEDPRKQVAQLKKHNRQDPRTEEPEDEAVDEKNKSPSLFDLSSTKSARQKLDQNLSDDQPHEENKQEISMSKTSLEDSDSTKQPRSAQQPAHKLVLSKQDVADQEQPSKDSLFKPKEKEDKSVPTARMDALNPQMLSQGASAIISRAKVEETPAPTQTIQDIVDQIAEHISQQEFSGKTETVVILKHPPIFADAKLVLTTFSNAKGEFNISFENLSQKAKAFLDSNNRLDNLKTNLEEKGYVTHMITTTTITENRVSDAAHQQNAFARDSEREDQQQQKKRQQDADEEEG